MENSNQKSNNLMLPISVIIAGVIIAGAVMFSGGNTETPKNNQQAEQVVEDNSLNNVREITSEDHIKGNPDAPIKIVEYSDFECPFCKSFHGTMNRIIDEYGESGQVAWVYRQFPLEQLHPVKAVAESVASECAAELGGNDGFWKFADRFFELTPSNNRTDIETVLPQIAKEIGLDETEFNECLNSGKYNDHIKSDIDNAVATGGRGTPWSILISPDGNKYPINGAQPYEAIKQLIEVSLKELE